MSSIEAFTESVWPDSGQTAKALHILVIVSAKDGSKQTILERKIPLVTIKSIAMSNLRDDWMVGGWDTSLELGLIPARF
jgi:hypothetical protein